MFKVIKMKARGMQFLNIPETYYDTLRENLKNSKIKLEEDFQTVSYGLLMFITLATLFVIYNLFLKLSLKIEVEWFPDDMVG